ncbi:hypothetical protein K469DRAFT_709209 [Zopfia rhizophila CBS 207.26]|uniref:CorA-like transporter domain-containing protein n=1 Tax=Zopfia rhizophila CBS 207.26 TaxID=1314779 RepID=A0A6A6E1I5_9PEZI|nr:hypothetical protein K469DRAFT_709209 [Zopfia rhizophila CBS 207.26]
METSRYFERTLFYDRSPAADEYYERSANTIFETDPKRSKIEIRIQSCKSLALFDRKATGLSGKELELRDETSNIPGKSAIEEGDFPWVKEDTDSQTISSVASSTYIETGLDQYRGDPDPPVYPGPSKLTVININDTGRLRDFVQETKSDFRVFYLRQRHSYSRVQVTKELFEQLLKSCRVFPRFNEYMIGFGQKDSESEVGPPPLKFHPLCESKDNQYRGFECSYILRYIEFTDRKARKQPWSLRQFAVYHRYKPKRQNWCSTWILVGASQRTEVRLDQYTRSIDDLVGSNPFEIHIIFLDTAIASWRPYLVDLTRQVTEQSNKALGTMVTSEMDFISLDVEDHQQLKQIEDQIADLMLCLDSTSDTIIALIEMYLQFQDHQKDDPQYPNPPRKSAFGCDAITFALKEKDKEIAYTRQKAEGLLSKVQNSRSLISSLLERQNGCALKAQVATLNQQVSALESLEQQSQLESAAMRELTEKGTRDSSSVRVLTIITLIYLPCTVVSNFYSTQFVNRRESGKIEYAQNYWLFFAISVPLTIFTLFVWYSWANKAKLGPYIANWQLGRRSRHRHAQQGEETPRRRRSSLLPRYQS